MTGGSKNQTPISFTVAGHKTSAQLRALSQELFPNRTAAADISVFAEVLLECDRLARPLNASAAKKVEDDQH